MLKGVERYAKSLRKRGIGLVAVMSALSVLSLFTGAILLTTVKTLGAVADGEYSDRARYAAYSGIQSALEQLNNPRDATHRGPGWSHAYYDGAPCPATIDSAREDVLQIIFPNNPDVQALVVVYNNSEFVTDPTYRSSTAPDGSPIPPGSIYISATGLVQGKKKIQLTSVSSLLAASGYHFDEALFANGKLNLKSGLIDSFDSTITTGTPDAAISTAADDAAYSGMAYFYRPYLNQTAGLANKRAPIGSNDNSDGAIELGDAGDLIVDGDVKTGTGATPGAISQGATTRVTGTQTYGNKQIPQTFMPSASTGYVTLEPPTTPGPPAPFNPGSTWNLTAGQTYFVNGDLLLDGTTVNVDTSSPNPTTIYVKSKLDIKNSSSLNWGKNPKMLQIYVMDENSGDIRILNSKGSFLMAAGGSTAKLEDSEIFGSIQAKEIEAHNAKVHFDSTLENTVVGKADFTNTNT
ncbi:MAG: hypothetical protein KIS61_13710, partial [Candidatus Eremiobacteraeota bacterium]|nr:hypothetical protein [Candidatus Eremiobacteraeota bacterium]